MQDCKRKKTIFKMVFGYVRDQALGRDLDFGAEAEVSVGGCMRRCVELSLGSVSIIPHSKFFRRAVKTSNDITTIKMARIML